MRTYFGVKIDENGKDQGSAYFRIFGKMADGSACYHEIVNGEEQENGWYSRTTRYGLNVFFYEGE